LEFNTEITSIPTFQTRPQKSGDDAPYQIAVRGEKWRTGGALNGTTVKLYLVRENAEWNNIDGEGWYGTDSNNTALSITNVSQGTYTGGFTLHSSVPPWGVFYLVAVDVNEGINRIGMLQMRDATLSAIYLLTPDPNDIWSLDYNYSVMWGNIDDGARIFYSLGVGIYITGFYMVQKANMSLQTWTVLLLYCSVSCASKVRVMGTTGGVVEAELNTSNPPQYQFWENFGDISLQIKVLANTWTGNPESPYQDAFLWFDNGNEDWS
tara:strand:- start:19986 stop:20780 length:795 start_codon:yes stop_codon:yes gene_type:complete